MMADKYYKILVVALVFLDLFFLSATLAYRITVAGEMANVPELTGMTLEEAKKILQEKKLSVVKSGVELNKQYERGKIISQDPPPKSRVKLNKIVKVTLSAGLEKVIVPKLTGKDLQSLDEIFQQVGLVKGNISHVHTSAFPAGRVISQYPPVETEVPVNSRVNLLVSQGSSEQRYLMPDLLGKQASKVIQKLKDLGFRIGDIRRSYYPGLRSGIIINQNPSQGTLIKKRNIISLEVSK
ncbi:MAG TPA: PASTA domain-containing protein [Acidobacteriota bacterium]|nr:PASTA domain-containing protein [Acidobacteriota bacterium]